MGCGVVVGLKGRGMGCGWGDGVGCEGEGLWGVGCWCIQLM